MIPDLNLINEYLTERKRYNPENLKFKEKEHDYFLNGKKLPSATEMNPFNTKFYESIGATEKGKKILELAKWRGVVFHMYMEDLMTGQHRALDLVMSQATRDAIEKGADFLHSFLDKLQILFIEHKFYDNTKGIFAGTVDCIAVDDENKKIMIIDWKGSNAPNPDNTNASTILKYRHQLDAYNYLFQSCYEINGKYLDYEIEGIIVFLNAGECVAMKMSTGNISWKYNPHNPEWKTRKI